jgi:hypothetical protein
MTDDHDSSRPRCYFCHAEAHDHYWLTLGDDVGAPAGCSAVPDPRSDPAGWKAHLFPQISAEPESYNEVPSDRSEGSPCPYHVYVTLCDGCRDRLTELLPVTEEIFDRLRMAAR